MKFLNLELEKIEMDPFDFSEIEKMYIAANFSESHQLSTSAMEDWALSNPELLSKLFENQVSPFFENCLTSSDKIYV